MPLILDQITRKKLVLVKQIYQRAFIDSKGILSKTNRIFSVIEFDLATETLLKVIVSALDTSKMPESDIHKLITQVNNILSSLSLGVIPDEAHIKHVRKIRNNAQHQAIYPNESDIVECQIYTRDFLLGITNQIWEIQFENISLADLIEDEKIRALVIEAETQQNQENYSNATDKISEALDEGMNSVESAIVGYFPHFVHGIAITDSFSIGRNNESYRNDRHSHDESEILDSIKKMRETLFYLALEMKISELVRYREIAGYTYSTMDGKHHRHGGKKEIKKEDVEFLLAYCVDTIVKIEEQVGSIRNPFGRK